MKRVELIENDMTFPRPNDEEEAEYEFKNHGAFIRNGKCRSMETFKKYTKKPYKQFPYIPTIKMVAKREGRFVELTGKITLVQPPQPKRETSKPNRKYYMKQYLKPVKGLARYFKGNIAFKGIPAKMLSELKKIKCKDLHFIVKGKSGAGKYKMEPLDAVHFKFVLMGETKKDIGKFLSSLKKLKTADYQIKRK